MKQITKFDRFLLKYSTLVDNVDMYLGPFTEIGRFSENELANDLTYAARIVELGILKAPFVAMYIARTRNFSALANWLPRELLSVVVPYGQFIKLLRNYENTAHDFYGVSVKEKDLDPKGILRHAKEMYAEIVK